MGDTTTLMDLASMLASASPAMMLAIFITALLRRWVILPRELDRAEARILEVERERDEYRSMTFRALNIGERVVTLTEDAR